MTAADRMNVRGMSLFSQGSSPRAVLPPSPRSSNGEGGSALSTATIRGYEYTTYVGWGHTCVTCGMPINADELCRRDALSTASGVAQFTYRHLNCKFPKEPHRQRSARRFR